MRGSVHGLMLFAAGTAFTRTEAASLRFTFSLNAHARNRYVGLNRYRTRSPGGKPAPFARHQPGVFITPSKSKSRNNTPPMPTFIIRVCTRPFQPHLPLPLSPTLVTCRKIWTCYSSLVQRSDPDKKFKACFVKRPE